MNYRLLLVDPLNPNDAARAASLRMQLLQTSPGGEDITVSFRPNRTDDLYASAKAAAELAYRIVYREGIVRSQLIVRCELSGTPPNIVGRSSELLFALAMLHQIYEEGDAQLPSFSCIAATGALDPDGTVRGVTHLGAKLRAILGECGIEKTIVFFPGDNEGDIHRAVLEERYPHVELVPVRHLDDALHRLGIVLERAYLGNPFRGLEQFNYEHRAIFFGREADITTFLRRLLSREQAGCPGALVLGASGCGKSSFVRAGVLPRLAEPALGRPALLHQRPPSRALHQAIWRPSAMVGAASERALTQSIALCFRSLPELRGNFAAGLLPETLTELAVGLQTHWPTNTRFVWFIDQLEELFGLGLTASLVNAFGAFLQQLQDQGAWTLATLRDDFLPALFRCTALRNVFEKEQGTYYIKSLDHAALEAAIVKPAIVSGLVYETLETGVRLDQVLRDEAFAQRESLPLLQFALAEIYRNRRGSILSFDSLRRLGGLMGAVSMRADDLTAKLTAAQRANLLSALGRMARIQAELPSDHPDAYSRIPVAWEDFSGERRALLAPLVDARLLVKSKGPRQSNTTVELAHEALIRHWAPLRQWLVQCREAILWRQDFLIPSLRRWNSSHDPKDLLAPNSVKAGRKLPLTELSLSDAELSYLQASGKALARRRASVLLAAAALASAGCLATLYARRENLTQYYTARAWDALEKRDWRDAIESSVSAAREARPWTRRMQPLLAAVVMQLPELAVLPQDEDLQFAIADSSTAVVESKNNVWSWDLAADRMVSHFGYPGRLSDIALTPLGILGLSVDDGHAFVWNASLGNVLSTISDNSVTRNSHWDLEELAASALRVVTWRSEEFGPAHFRVWSALSGKEVAHYTIEGVVDAVSLSRDGSQLLTIWSPGGNNDSRAILRDALTGKAIEHLPYVAESAELSVNGDLMLVTSFDDTVFLWDVRRNEPIKTFAASEASFAESADYVVLLHKDEATGRSTVTVEHVERDDDNGEVRTDTVFSERADDAVISPDGMLIATRLGVSLVRVWDVSSGLEERSFPHEHPVTSLRFATDGSQLLTYGDDHTAWAWRLAPKHQLVQVAADDAKNVRFSTDGLRLIAETSLGAQVWDALTGRELFRFDVPTWNRDHARYQNVAKRGDPVDLGVPKDYTTVNYDVSPDGRHVLVWFDRDSPMQLWDGDAGRELVQFSPLRSMVTFSSDGALVRATDADGTVRIWDALTGKSLVPSRDNHHSELSSSTTQSRDGSLAAAVIKNEIHVTGTKTGEELQRFVFANEIQGLEFSPNAKYLLVLENGSAHILSIEIGRELASMAPAEVATFSPDGNRLVTASRDRWIRVWDLSPLEMRINELSKILCDSPLTRCKQE